MVLLNTTYLNHTPLVANYWVFSYQTIEQDLGTCGQKRIQTKITVKRSLLIQQL
jgi:hypothetical protein